MYRSTKFGVHQATVHPSIHQGERPRSRSELPLSFEPLALLPADNNYSSTLRLLLQHSGKRLRQLIQVNSSHNIFEITRFQIAAQPFPHAAADVYRRIARVDA